MPVVRNGVTMTNSNYGDYKAPAAIDKARFTFLYKRYCCLRASWFNHETRSGQTRTETVENRRASELSGALWPAHNRNELESRFATNLRDAIYDLDIGDSVTDMGDIKYATALKLYTILDVHQLSMVLAPNKGHFTDDHAVIRRGSEDDDGDDDDDDDDDSDDEEMFDVAEDDGDDDDEDMVDVVR